MTPFDKMTERNKRVQARYDELMREGKHGHYETMFRVVHEEVAAALADDEVTVNLLDAEIAGWDERIDSRAVAHNVLAALRRHILGK